MYLILKIVLGAVFGGIIGYITGNNKGYIDIVKSNRFGDEKNIYGIDQDMMVKKRNVGLIFAGILGVLMFVAFPCFCAIMSWNKMDIKLLVALGFFVLFGGGISVYCIISGFQKRLEYKVGNTTYRL